MPAILLYAENITNRVRYTSRLLFQDLLSLDDVRWTTNLEELQSFDGIRLNYSSQVVENAKQIKPAKLLFEKRINDQKVPVLADELPRIFPNDGPLGFDPLAAVFFLVTRYEEYLPHRSDQHGRFPPRESLAYKHGFLKTPIVERYAAILASYFEVELSLNPELEVSFDIDQAYAIKYKGWFRTALGFGKESLKGDINGLLQRLKVLAETANDPLDVYSDLLKSVAQKSIRPIFFLQVGENSKYDINGPSYHHGFQSLVANLEQEAAILGLHPSYYSSGDSDLLGIEHERLQSITAASVTKSRQHYLRFQLPSTFTRLEELGIMNDYSMGYAELDGFRAGISRPYKFYNLLRDEPSQLTIHPFCFMDMVGLRAGKNRQEHEVAALEIWGAVKNVGGRMSTVWHLESLTGLGFKRPTLPLLKSLMAAS